MIININKDKIIITESVQDKESISTKIVDSLPDDIDTYYYKYINGEMIKGGLYDELPLSDTQIKNNFNEQETINDDNTLASIDLDYRLTCLELGL